jgi:hypothetical protein
MRIGIYDRWLGTLGGGERHCLAVAEHLSHRHEVSVISHTPQVRKLIESRFELDLSAVNFLDIPEYSPAQLSARTSEFDTFINASQGDFICSRAVRSAWLVYFPVPIHQSVAGRLRARVGRELRGRLKFMTFVEGVFGVQSYGALEARRVAPRAVINFRPSNLDYEIQFALAAADNQTHRIRLALDGQIVQQLTLPANGQLIDCCVTAPGRSGVLAHRLELETDYMGTLHPIVITELRINHPVYLTYRILLENMFPAWGLRLANVPTQYSMQIRPLNQASPRC